MSVEVPSASFVDAWGRRGYIEWSSAPFLCPCRQDPPPSTLALLHRFCSSAAVQMGGPAFAGGYRAGPMGAGGGGYAGGPGSSVPPGGHAARGPPQHYGHHQQQQAAAMMPPPSGAMYGGSQGQMRPPPAAQPGSHVHNLLQAQGWAKQQQQQQPKR